jgi:photosystem II stability/assembly factor-like uncharacterized protein
LVFGLRGNLFRSDDDGAGWSAIATGTEATLQGGIATAAGGVLIAGLGGTVLASDDGRAFTAATLRGREGLSGVIAVPGGTLVYGEGGVRRWPT